MKVGNELSGFVLKNPSRYRSLLITIVGGRALQRAHISHVRGAKRICLEFTDKQVRIWYYSRLKSGNRSFRMCVGVGFMLSNLIVVTLGF